MSELFRLESPPPRETRSQKARIAVVAAIRAGHAERDRVAGQEADNRAFRARAWLVMSVEQLVDVFDPADGATLDGVLAELAGRFEGKASSYWHLRDLAIWRADRLVATVAGGPSGEPEVTRYGRRACADPLPLIVSAKSPGT